ncbi:hypothetical protein KUTeg_013087 [Tegillarca granosa]|uniref:ubiquitinyl hydrolase 1 n=1 Tax=Tegillarca granosa TaxID=220873 RepID=A0ABQ9ESP1_TEGGR|nr:hypothetical protein KUTeg_013087 [Tegillarca granosa]
METIFHEKQEGSLCAQHCLNALLQGQYFSPVDLADLARQLDEQERQQMAEGGHTDEYRRFLQQPSSNFDDSGFFSIQVIENAVRVWGLELMQFNSQNPLAVAARQNPVKLGYQWFNLNSLLTGPELISDTYLSLFLTQLQQEGYSIFIVRGELPECEADQILRFAPAVQPIKPRLINESQSVKKSEEGPDDQLQQALAESRQLEDSEDKMLQKALQMSMEGYVIEEDKPDHTPGTSTGIRLSGETVQNNGAIATESMSQEEIRQRRLEYLNRLENKSTTQNCDNNTNILPQCLFLMRSKTKAPVCTVTKDTSEDTPQESKENGDISEEDMLNQAIAMSMEGMN